MHDLVGWGAGWIAGRFGGGQVVQTLAKELASNLQLPPDVKFIAVARGLQITGILLCLANGKDLTRCQCFIDLAMNETKSRVKKLLAAAVEDWVNLATFPPPDNRH
jgi:hypothetical protein